jgi:hypothetical protein
MFIQLDDGKINDFAKSAGNGRFSSPTSAKNNNALHCHIFMVRIPTKPAKRAHRSIAIGVLVRHGGRPSR